ncbi:MAG: RNase adapter RapZ [Arenicellales bacterium]|nr:RNase adapter RapZ [Gammaproteobacteria bacterium]
MDLIIVSGLSGSGKSIALHALEDMGYFCIDNLPAKMLGALSHLLHRDPSYGVDNIAVSIDSRNREFLRTLDKNLASLRASGIHPRVLFLEASNDRIMQRYSETRRRHPLTNPHTSLMEGIADERRILAPIAQLSDRVIDTSVATPQGLRAAIRGFADGTLEKDPILMLQSFGYKHGIPREADTVVDLRCLPNPYWQEDLRDLNGLDGAVIDFLEHAPAVDQMVDQLTTFLKFWVSQFDVSDRPYLTVAFGCTGGQHRSVYMVERLARLFRETDRMVQIRHRDLQSVSLPFSS